MASLLQVGLQMPAYYTVNTACQTHIGGQHCARLNNIKFIVDNLKKKNQKKRNMCEKNLNFFVALES